MNGVPVTPVSLTTAVVGLVNAVLALLLAFGVSITQGQTAAIVTVVNALLIVGAVVYDQLVKRRAAVKPAG
jgi:hypothetical protein